MSISLSMVLPNPQWRPTSLVIGPGGMRGYAIMGVLEVLEDNGKLLGVKHIVGCSVGSVIGYLKIVGYTIKQITEINFFDQDTVREIITSTLADPLILFENILKKGGLIDMEVLYKVLQRLTHTKTGQNDITFQDLYNLSKTTFTVVTYDKTNRTVRYMNHIYTPDRLVGRSVIMSCSVPGVFQQILENGIIYLDGAVGNPYPVDFVDNGIDQVLGIYIEEDYDSDAAPSNNILSNLMDIISIPVLEHRKRIIDRSTPNVRHICISCKSMVFLSDDTRKQELFEKGRRTAEDFLIRLSHGLPVNITIAPTPIIPD